MYYIDGPTGPRQTVFERRIKQAGRRKTVVDVYYNNVLVKEDIVIDGGEVSIDRHSAVRRSGRINVVDASLGRTMARELLSPYGTEVKIRHGIVYPNGEEELIPLGVFIIDSIAWDEGISQEFGGHSHTLELLDRSMVPQRADLGPTLTYTGWTMEAVINKLMAWFYPDLTVTYDSMLSTWRNPGGTSFNSGNHWEIMQRMAQNMGGDIFFDVNGLPVVEVTPTISSTTEDEDAVWVVSGLTEDGTLTGAKRSITREGVYNSVYVLGAAPVNGGVVPFGAAVNVDADSPTNRNSAFRKIGKRIEDSTLTTEGQCMALANKKLNEYKQLSKTLVFEAVPNPLLDVGDIVLMEYPTGETELGMIESISFPLGSGTFTGTCSTARV